MPPAESGRRQQAQRSRTRVCSSQSAVHSGRSQHEVKIVGYASACASLASHLMTVDGTCVRPKTAGLFRKHQPVSLTTEKTLVNATTTSTEKNMNHFHYCVSICEYAVSGNISSFFTITCTCIRMFFYCSRNIYLQTRDNLEASSISP